MIKLPVKATIKYPALGLPYYIAAMVNATVNSAGSYKISKMKNLISLQKVKFQVRM